MPVEAPGSDAQDPRSQGFAGSTHLKACDCFPPFPCLLKSSDLRKTLPEAAKTEVEVEAKVEAEAEPKLKPEPRPKSRLNVPTRIPLKLHLGRPQEEY